MNFFYLPAVFQKFFLVCQKRMIQRNAGNGFDFFICEFQSITTLLFYVFPKLSVLAQRLPPGQSYGCNRELPSDDGCLDRLGRNRKSILSDCSNSYYLPFRLKIKSVLFSKIFYVYSIYNFIAIAESLQQKPIDSYKGLPFSVASRLISVTFRDFASSIRSSSIFLQAPCGGNLFSNTHSSNGRALFPDPPLWSNVSKLYDSFIFVVH